MLTWIVTKLQSDNPGISTPLWPPCGPSLSWLTQFHWRVRLFSQDSVPLAPPSLARWARDSSWRPGRTCQVMSSQSSCAWPGRRCRSARIWAVPHSPRTVLPVRQRAQRSVSAINVPGHNLWKLFFSTCRKALFHLNHLRTRPEVNLQ